MKSFIIRLASSIASFAAAAASLPPGFVRVPGGAMHASCVHAHAHGARLVEAQLPRCAHAFLRGEDGGVRGVGGAHGSAWKSWSQFSLGGAADSVTSLSSTWAVPPEPPAAGRQPDITVCPRALCSASVGRQTLAPRAPQ
jgi:hypothetical protein